MQKDLQNSLTALGESKPLGATESLSDTKLINFFILANTGKTINNTPEYRIPLIEELLLRKSPIPVNEYGDGESASAR